MTRYSEELKDKLVEKMLSTDAVSVETLAKETGIARSTLYKWKQACGARSSSTKWRSQDKFNVLIETASFNEVELGEYCRKKGIYVEDIDAWKQAAINGNREQGELDAVAKKAASKVHHELVCLRRDIGRKDKALAEAAALLILSKKANAIWGDPEAE